MVSHFNHGSAKQVQRNSNLGSQKGTSTLKKFQQHLLK